MLNKKNLKNTNKEDHIIYYLYDYLPYYKRDQGTYEEKKIMNHILNLKHHPDHPVSEYARNNPRKKEKYQINALKFFLNELLFDSNIINLDTDMVICNVPSSNSYILDSGINKLLENLVGLLNLPISKSIISGNFEDGSHGLIRFIDIKSSHSGGCRSKEIHLGSISSTEETIFRNKNVLLIDDIVTTGSSIIACKELIKSTKPLSIECLVLGKTI